MDFQSLDGRPCFVPYAPGVQACSIWNDALLAFARRASVEVRTVYSPQTEHTDPDPVTGVRGTGLWVVLHQEDRDFKGGRSPGGLHISGAVRVWTRLWAAEHPFEAGRVFDLREPADAVEAIRWIRNFAFRREQIADKMAQQQTEAATIYAAKLREDSARRRAALYAVAPNLAQSERECVGSVQNRAGVAEVERRIEELPSRIIDAAVRSRVMGDESARTEYNALRAELFAPLPT